MASRTLVATTSGLVHLLAEVDGRLAWFQRAGGAGWERMTRPPAPHAGFWGAAAASSDGRLCFGALQASERYAVHWASAEAAWSTAAHLPEDESPRALGFTPENHLLIATDGGNVYEYVDSGPRLVASDFHSARGSTAEHPARRIGRSWRATTPSPPATTWWTWRLARMEASSSARSG